MKYSENSAFDKEQDYNAKLLPLINEMEKICKAERIPMFITVCVKNNAEESAYKSNMVSPRYCERGLNTDYIAEIIKVMRGYRAVPPNEVLSQEGKTINPDDDFMAFVQETAKTMNSGEGIDGEDSDAGDMNAEYREDTLPESVPLYRTESSK